MNFQNFYITALACCVFSVPALAQPVQISPYPGKVKVLGAGGEDISPILPLLPDGTEVISNGLQNGDLELPSLDAPVVYELPVEGAVVVRSSESAPAPEPEIIVRRVELPEGFVVPQPGDVYFDEPGAIIVQTEAQVEFQAEFEAPTPVTAPRVREVIVPVASVSSANAEPISVRMSEPLDDLIASPPEEALLRSARVNAVSRPVEERVSHQENATLWDARSDVNIEHTLRGWIDNSDVELIWDTPDAFLVREEFSMNDLFEVAVQRLLDQYRDESLRPVATLHVDPDTQVKTLVVKSLSVR